MKRKGNCVQTHSQEKAAPGGRGQLTGSGWGGPERLREGGLRELALSQAEHCPPHRQACLELVNVTLFENRVSGVIKLRWGSPGLG